MHELEVLRADLVARRAAQLRSWLAALPVAQLRWSTGSAVVDLPRQVGSLWPRSPRLRAEPSPARVPV